MPHFYFTPAAIAYLTQVILSLAITLYLAGLFQKRRLWTVQTRLLSGFFACVSVFVALLFLDAALLPSTRLHAVFLENTALSLLLVFLLQFAYHFPRRFLNWEPRLALAASLGYALYEIQFAAKRYVDLLGGGNNSYRPNEADYVLVLYLLWVPWAFLRQCVAADPRPVRWWRKLLTPQSQEARATREFAFIYSILFLLGLVNILRAQSVVSTMFLNISLSSGILVVMWLFVSRYVQFVPGGATLLTKLSAVTLTLFLAVMGGVGWVVSPAYTWSYRPVIQDRQTLRFTPNVSGGYDVAPVEFHFEEELGERVQVEYDAVKSIRGTKVDFDFPFYGKNYPEVYVTASGMITLGQGLYHPNLQICCNRLPSVVPLLVDLNDKDGTGGVFVRRDPGRLVVTWNNLHPQSLATGATYTFQAVLHADGVIEFTYNGLPEPILFRPDASPSSVPWLRGLLPGQGESFDDQSVPNLAQALHSGGMGVGQNFYLDYRQYLDSLGRPLAALVLGISLLLMALLPTLLNTLITRPLNALLEGVRRMEAGALEVEIPVKSQDDIGYLTASFNKMAATLNSLVSGLEQRVSERTSELVAANQRLRAEMESREQVQARLLEQQRSLAGIEERERLSRELHDGLGQIMGYINVQTQAAQALFKQGQHEAAQHSLDRVAQMAQEAHGDIRNFILGLRAQTQDPQQTLYAMLGAYVRQFSQDTGIQVDLSLPDEDEAAPGLNAAVEEQVLHIIQEALTNVRKHSAAGKAEVWFSFDESNLQVIVSDDGCGFDPRTEAENQAHFGLKMMRERAELTGGRLEVRSAPGRGTKVMAYIPHFADLSSVEDLSPADRLLDMRILLVDDSPIFLEGLRNLLRARGLNVIGMAHDGLEAQEMARDLRPDVIVMDVMMPRCNGLEATKAIKAEFPATRIVMLTVSEEDSHLFEAIQNGASGFLLKGMDANQFCTLLGRLTHGETPLMPGAASRLVSEFSHIPSNARSTDRELSQRQWQILDLVSSGLTYKEVGQTLHLSEKTVKYHMAQILERLNLDNRLQAIAYARRLRDT